MFRTIAEKTVNLLIKHRILDKYDVDIYIYGLEVVLLNGLLLISFLMMSIWFDMIFHFVGFIVVFVPLRVFTGGYHAKRSETCFIMSNVIYLLSLVIAKESSELHNNIYVIMVTLVLVFVMYIGSPVENQNRPLTDYQLKRNRIITFIVIAIDFVLLLVLLKFDNNIASSVIIFMFLNGGLFILGILDNMFTQ